MFAMSQALFLIVSYTSVHLVLQPLYEVGAKSIDLVWPPNKTALCALQELQDGVLKSIGYTVLFYPMSYN